MTGPAPHGSRARFLVTGAHGCVGAWTVRQLLSDGAYVVAFDLSPDPHRLRLLVSDEQLAGLASVRGDITDLAAIEATLDEHEITHVIHLAALQVPFCRADPPLGARVNVVGTVNVLEAVARRLERMAPLVYASSVAAYEDLEGLDGVPARADAGTPGTIYGVYKRANEGSAAIYWRERGVRSVGLRPHTVYGPGRDQGLTSAPTSAMLAAAAGRPYRIPYGGSQQLQYAADVARAFIAASCAAADGASVHNLAGHCVHMGALVAAIEAAVPGCEGMITYEETPLPFPEAVDSSTLSELLGALPDTPLESGVAETVARFRELLASGRIALAADAAPAPAPPATEPFSA